MDFLKNGSFKNTCNVSVLLLLSPVTIPDFILTFFISLTASDPSSPFEIKRFRHTTFKHFLSQKVTHRHNTSAMLERVNKNLLMYSHGL